ncbi:MAG: hypothetical protein AAGJ93_17650 [Bacteroidota bacterium]
MIYIWYNPVLDSYELGSLHDLREARKACQITEDFILLYRFPEKKRWLANKIVKQLNSSTSDEEKPVDEKSIFQNVT